jgi:hypothetical protein
MTDLTSSESKYGYMQLIDIVQHIAKTASKTCKLSDAKKRNKQIYKKF